MRFALRPARRARGRASASPRTSSPRAAEDATRRQPRPRQRSQSLAALYQATEERFGGKRAWQRVDRLLEQADLPLKTAELAWLSAACGLIAGLLGASSACPTWVALLGFAGGAAAPLVPFVRMKARKRIQAFEAQLPDVLITLAASLRAGHSLRQAILAVVEESHRAGAQGVRPRADRGEPRPPDGGGARRTWRGACGRRTSTTSSPR